MILLSSHAVAPLLAARRDAPGSVRTSLDLNLSEADVRVETDGAVFPDGQSLSWAALEKIQKNDAAAFLVTDNAAEKVTFFSPALNRVYGLRPTSGAPTMLVGGFPMHRIKGVDPQEDTRRKIETVAPVLGRVLDTTTGLGYTAILAARTADRVLTIELDPTALRVARLNPWSQALFDNPKIEQRVGSATDVVPTLPDGAFQRILHDPPTLSLGGELYSGEFYRELYRVLARGGKLFHYIGDLESRSGASVVRGVMRRLQEAGFSKPVRHPEAFAVTAGK